MQYINRILKRYATATLVSQGLRREQKVTRRAIMQCHDLLSDALGQSWQRASREAAAGMVLVLLARESELDDFFNDRGWEMVLTSVGDHSRMVMDISPRTMSDIRAWQATRLEALLAKAA